MAAGQQQRPTMKDSRDLYQQISESLAAIDSELIHIRDKQREHEAKRERLKTAQGVLLELQGADLGERHSSATSQTKDEMTRVNSRAFHSEGQTVALIRFLYGKNGGSTVIDASKRTGVSMRRTRTSFDRLRAGGYMVRSGQEFTLTRKGIEAWQNSPLFRKDAKSA
jgi:hypothetical protein